MDVAVVAVLFEPGGIFTVKEQKTETKAFLLGRDVFALLATVFGKSLVKHFAYTPNAF